MDSLGNGGRRGTRLASAGIVLVGILEVVIFFWAGTLVSVPTTSEPSLLLVTVSPLVALLGAIHVVWGVSSAIEGRWTSLTAARSFVAPIIVAAVHVPGVDEPPPTDVVPRLDPWQPPETMFDFAVGILDGGGFALPGGIAVGFGLFFVMGVAVASDEPRWFAITLSCIFLLSWIAAVESAFWFLFPLIGAIPGYVPYIAGTRLARPEQR